ncbi:hypothetical protein GF386_02760 [Candidatus Pacearchaeota archaeon]|nr:hypothetical protein [Candidatus Pacearchaeota archaeon]MBD3283069.1 hypothetical protein [Candidatus Pacearchaeota archaeon]
MTKKRPLEDDLDSSSKSSSEAVLDTSYALTDSGMPIPLGPGDPRRTGVQGRQRRQYPPRDSYDYLTPALK